MSLCFSLTSVDTVLAQAGGSLFYPKQDAPWGRGVFEEMHWKQMTSMPAANIENPYLGGAVIHLPWALLEPERGKLDTAMLDKILALWASRGKKIILHVSTSPGGFFGKAKQISPFAESATPPWVYHDGAQAITLTADGRSQRIPVVWNPVFQKDYLDFLRALAAKYDGNPGIEFIIVAPGVYDSTRIIYPEARAELPGIGYTDVKWFTAVTDVLNLYQQVFKRTPLALCIAPYVSDPGDHEDPRYSHLALGKWASEHGFYVYYHNLRGTENWLTSAYPRLFATFPAGAKFALGIDNPISANKNMALKYGDPRTIVQYAFGDGPSLKPLHPSYIIFYEEDVAIAHPGDRRSSPAFVEALQLAVDKLQKP